MAEEQDKNSTHDSLGLEVLCTFFHRSVKVLTCEHLWPPQGHAVPFEQTQ